MQTLKLVSNEAISPTLKWVGGKRRIASKIIALFPETYGTYFEPFLGGAALFLAAQPPQAVLSDINSSLISYYIHLRDVPAALVKSARELEAKFNECRDSESRRDFYYKARTDFNAAKSSNSLEEAALFLFVNKTSFNGLYRENSRGEFNVPFNNRSQLTLIDEPNFIANARAFSNTELRVASFEEGINGAADGDLVYFDPPYVPLSKTAAFTDYTKSPFGPLAQEKLRNLAMNLAENGVTVVLSNSYSDEVKELYSDFDLHRVSINRLVAASSSARGSMSEYLIIGRPRD